LVVGGLFPAGAEPLLLPPTPPQAINPASNITRPIKATRDRRNAGSTIMPKASGRLAKATILPLCKKALVRGTVEIVSVELTRPDPNVNELGANAQVAPAGKVPHANVTGLARPCPATAMV
jgi:hypothetical protein